MKKWPWWIKTLGVLVLLFGLVQLIPYGRNHQNPAVVLEATFDNQTTKTLTTNSCYDCHSNETIWPWYSNVAPVSWLIQRDVDEGRQRLNFSEWSSKAVINQALFGAAAEKVAEGEMPPFYYVWLHPNAKLTADTQSQLLQGFQNSGK